MTKALEQSLKDKIKGIAKTEGRTFNDVWRSFVLERFLVRLARSEYREKLIYKGGMLLARYIEIGRETVDLDFLARKMRLDVETMEKAIHKIIEIIFKDGLAFQIQGTSVLSQPHMEYRGYRVSLVANLGRTRTPFNIDIGVGDVTKPITKEIQLLGTNHGALFEEEISLKVYPLEAIFAEKLDSVAFRGAKNSRMKDYHDLLLIMRSKNLLSMEKLKRSVSETIRHRKTALSLPLTFTSTELENFQRLWDAHWRQLLAAADELKIPARFEDVLSEINKWLERHPVAK